MARQVADPFGFMGAINWDVVDERADEIVEIFAEAQAEDEQAHWEDDPEYRAIYCPPPEPPC